MTQLAGSGRKKQTHVPGQSQASLGRPGVPGQTRPPWAEPGLPGQSQASLGRARPPWAEPGVPRPPLLHLTNTTFFFFRLASCSDSKRPTCNAGDPSSIPGSGRSPRERNGFPLQYSCLENSMNRGAWKGDSPWGRKRVGHD